MITLPRAISLAVPALIAALSWWLFQQVTTHDEQQSSAPSHQPDYYFDDFVLTAMDTAGYPRHRLSAKHMEHHPDNDTSEITSPTLQIYTPDAPPWLVQSERGWVSANGEEIHLLGEVSIQRDAAPGVSPVQVSTRDLLVTPDKKYAETEHITRVISTGIKVQSVGMRIYLAEGRVELLSKVRGKYDPKQGH